jgi:O-antigen/teichoic acid export membrane protein
VVKLGWILRQSSIYMVGDFLRRALSVILLPFYTHHLSTSDYGTIELLDLFILVANVSLGGLAIGEAMVRIYYEEREENQAQVVSTALWSIVALSTVMAGVGIVWAAPASLLLFHKPGYENLIRMSFLAMFCGNIIETGLMYQRLKQRAGFFILLSGGLLALNAGLNIYYIAFAKWGLRGFFWGKWISAAVGAAILLVGILREVHWTFRRDLAARITRFGAPLILSGFSVFIIHYSDRFFLDRYSTLAEIGIYALAYKFGFLIGNLIQAPFESAWNVKMYDYVSSPGWQKEFARVFRYLLFFLVLTGLALSVTREEALAMLAPPAYGAAAVLVPIIVLAYVVRGAGDFFRGVLFVNKRVRIFSAATCVCALLNLALNQSLIPRWGARGAAWATLFTWLAYMIFCWILAHREHHLPYPLRSFGQIFGLAGMVYAAAAVVNRLPGNWRWGPDALMVLLFVGLLWATGYFPAEDRKRICERLELWRGGSHIPAWRAPS